MTDYHLQVCCDELIIFRSFDKDSGYTDLIELGIGDRFVIKYDLQSHSVHFRDKKIEMANFLYRDKMVSIAGAITKGLVVDITQQIIRDEKLNQLGL